MTYQPKFCTRLKEQRKQLGLSQEGAAKVLKVGLRTYQRWEIGSAVPNHPAQVGVSSMLDAVSNIYAACRLASSVAAEAPEPPLQPVSGDLTPAVEQVPGAAEEAVQNQQEERQDNQQSADQGQSEAARADLA